MSSWVVDVRLQLEVLVTSECYVSKHVGVLMFLVFRKQAELFKIVHVVYKRYFRDENFQRFSSRIFQYNIYKIWKFSVLFTTCCSHPLYLNSMDVLLVLAFGLCNTLQFVGQMLLRMIWRDLTYLITII